MNPSDRLQRLVEEEVADEPFVVESTDGGFDLSMDLDHDHWVEKFHAGGMSYAMVWHVRVDANGSYTILDDRRTVEWGAGVLGFGGRYEREVGVFSPRRQISWEFADGKFQKVGDVTYGTEGRDLITDAAEQLGLRKRRHWVVSVLMAFAIVAAIGSVLTVVGLLWAAGTGRL